MIDIDEKFYKYDNGNVTQKHFQHLKKKVNGKNIELTIKRRNKHISKARVYASLYV